jgi:phenylacetate-coenzyme A ligase PaaK-like adenylate-forming protein
LIEQWLSEDIDQWTKRIVRRHFDPVTGSPYWLDRAAGLSFDPRDITRHEELSAFGVFPTSELQTLDPADLVPLDLPRPLSGRIWESDGTTGDPCRIYYSEPMLEHCLVWRRWVDDREGFEPRRNWLLAMPTGPHIMSHWAWGLTELDGARVYGIDFDPRWVNHQLRAGQMREAMQYTEHVIDQLAAILTTQPVDYICTTPALLRAISRREPELVAQLKGARLGGTHVTPEMWRVLAKALNGGLLSISYGNTFGNALTLSVLEEGELIAYVPNYPHITMAVVDTGDWTRVVDYGKDGRVRLTVMHEHLFLPNILERDLAMRYDTGDEWPCDGVANVRPLPELNKARSPSAYAQIRLAQLRRGRG